MTCLHFHELYSPLALKFVHCRIVDPRRFDRSEPKHSDKGWSRQGKFEGERLCNRGFKAFAVSFSDCFTPIPKRTVETADLPSRLEFVTDHDRLPFPSFGHEDARSKFGITPLRLHGPRDVLVYGV